MSISKGVIYIAFLDVQFSQQVLWFVGMRHIQLLR